MKIEHEFTVGRPTGVGILPGHPIGGPVPAGCRFARSVRRRLLRREAVGEARAHGGFIRGEGDGERRPGVEERCDRWEGVDRSGGSRGQVKVTYQIVPDGTGSKVGIDADVTLSGLVAQFGRTGLINEMSKRLIGEFVQCLEGKLSAETASEASTIEAGEVRGISLFLCVALELGHRAVRAGEKQP